MQRPKVKAADFVGQEAYLAQREARTAEDRALHADRRRPHLGVRREALHARRRADPHPRRRHPHRRARPPPLRHHRRLGAVARQARAAGLPAAGGGRIGNELAVSYMEELYPVTVGSVDATPLLDPANERHALMTGRPRLRQAGADSSSEVVLTEDGAGRRRPVRRLHDEPPRGVRRRARGADRRRDGRHGDRAHPRRRRTPSSSCARRSPSAAPPPPTSRPTPPRSARPTSPARSPRWSATTRPPGARHDLVLLGNDAADSGDFQVGIRLAYELGRPVVNGADTVAVDGRPRRRPRSKGPDGHETYRVPLPAVVTVLEGGVEPRYPSVPGPDEGQEGRGRGARRRPPSRPDRSGCGCCCRRRCRATCRSSARAPTPRPPSSTCSSSWGCWPDDPGAGRDRRLRRGRGVPGGAHLRPQPVRRGRGSAGRRGRGRRAAVRPSASPSSWRRTASATCTTSPATRSRRTPAPPGPPRCSRCASRPGRWW